MSHVHRRRWLIDKINSIEDFEIRTSCHDPIVQEFRDTFMDYDSNCRLATSEINNIMKGLVSDGFMLRTSDPVGPYCGSYRYYIKIKEIRYTPESILAVK